MKTQWKLPSFSLDLSDLFALLGKTPDATALAKAEGGMRAAFKSGEVGFYDFPVNISSDEVGAMAAAAKQIRSEFDSALVMGIGGSYLGGATLFQALRSPEEEDAFPIHWVSNVDPAAIRRTEYFLKKRRAAAVVISKSGGTSETLSAFFKFAPKLDAKGFVAITDPKKGELRRLAETNGWRSFPVPPNVGGRYSVLTAVGLFPAFLGGLPVEEILRGAREMREALDGFKAAENPAYLMAAAQHAFDVEKRHNVHLLMAYASNMRLLADWYVQLFAESIGKKQRHGGKAVGFTPMGGLGTSDQHSFLQLLKEGPNDKVVGFLDVLAEGTKMPIGKPPFEVREVDFLFPHGFEQVNHLACEATRTSLKNSQVPTYRIEVPNTDGRTLGALFFFFETVCAFMGELYDVDAFNQPGVEESKRLLRAAL